MPNRDGASSDQLVFGSSAAGAGIRIEAPAGVGADGNPIWGFKATVTVERYVSRDEAALLSSEGMAAGFTPQAAPASLLRLLAAQGVLRLLKAPLARGIHLEAGSSSVKALASALAAASKKATSDSSIPNDIATLSEANLRQRMDKLLLLSGEGPAVPRALCRGTGLKVTTATSQDAGTIKEPEPAISRATDGAESETIVSDRDTGATLEAAAGGMAYYGVDSVSQSNVLNLDALRGWLSSMDMEHGTKAGQPQPTAAIPTAGSHPALRVFPSETAAEMSMTGGAPKSKPVIAATKKTPSIADGIEGISGPACLQALDETIRVLEGRAYSSALALLL